MTCDSNGVMLEVSAGNLFMRYKVDAVGIFVMRY